MPRKNLNYVPKPLFDTLAETKQLYKDCQEYGKSAITTWLKNCFQSNNPQLPIFTTDNYQVALNFLYSYRGSTDTFNSYRREIEKFLQWSWFVHGTSVTKLKRLDIEAFIEFCMKPYKRWIQTKMVQRFLKENGQKIPNPQWRPFVVKISKKDFKNGHVPDKENFQLTQQGLRPLFAILSSFYQFMIQEELTEINPVIQIRQKSKFIQKDTTTPTIRRLSNKQWQTVLNVADEMRHKDPQHERTVFILHALCNMYLRISELTDRPIWTPTMGDFFRDSDGNWWFKVVGKGNKARQIAVGPTMLEALKAWRKHLGLPLLPTPDESLPLLPNQRSGKPIKGTHRIRRIVQMCFDAAVLKLEKISSEEAEILRSATAHWLRHTGISEDVKIRPREHVRDDAGHSSGAITDRYIDVELRERAKSARRK